MLPLDEVRGLRDEYTGEIVSNAFKTGVLTPIEVENQWQRLIDGESPPRPVALKVMGLDCYKIEGQPTR